MGKIDKLQLIAFETVLDMIGSDDFPLVHATVANRVASGVINKETEKAYCRMVDKKLKERGEL